MIRTAALVLCSAALLCGLAPARADDDVTLYHRSVAAGGSDPIASTGRIAMHFHVSSAQAMRVYVRAIRYFNPGIDEAEAQQIVYAIVSEAHAANIDPRLVVAIVATESAFDRTARSSAGAMGLGQLMPSTAAADRVSDTSDISQNIHGTVLTLKGNLEHYAALDAQHQYEYAIAAYNAGTGAVDRYNSVPPYDETINYVTKVIALWRRFWGLSST